MIRLLALLLMLPGLAGAVTCTDIAFEDLSFTACEIDPAQEDLRLFHSDDSGKVLGTFSALEQHVGEGRLLFAMNAGMYHADRSPVGLYVEDGDQRAKLVTRDGPGNFGLLPNGVLCLTDTGAQVWESRAFDKAAPTCRDATQSGPMLVIDGELHPRFIPGGSSTYIRNGVGVRPDGKALFVISNDPVNFHTFGRLFRDVLGTPNALFLDGKVSRLYVRETGRRDFAFTLAGPMVGVVAP